MLSTSEAVNGAVSFVTFAPQILWVLMTFYPRERVTREVMGSPWPVLGLSAVHFAILVLASSGPAHAPSDAYFAIFDPSNNQIEKLQKIFTFKNFVAEQWPHTIVWDLLAGRAIWLDSLYRNIYGNGVKCSIAVVDWIGPPGLLLYTLISLSEGKGIPSFGGPAPQDMFWDMRNPNMYDDFNRPNDMFGGPNRGPNQFGRDQRFGGPQDPFMNGPQQRQLPPGQQRGYGPPGGFQGQGRNDQYRNRY